MALNPGAFIGGFEIVSKLGSGGMGDVYRARDLELGREVALKILPEDLSRHEERRARFEREARLLAALNHPRIATLYHFGEHEGSRLLVMELVEGETLAERIARGPLVASEAIPIFQQIAEALEFAHHSDIVHRDLKPANIKLTPAGSVKVLDFGLAKALGVPPERARFHESRTRTRATEAGVILGTVPYLSPEQARGKPLDKRADIWAFGCILYEALTGVTAFDGDTASDTIAAILGRDPDWSRLPAETPWSLASLIRRCLKKDPAHRIHDIADVRIELAEAAVEPETRVQSDGPDRRVRGWWLAAAFALALATLPLWNVRHPEITSGGLVRAGISLSEDLSLEWAPTMAISPDGSRIVYTVTREDESELYLRELSSTESAPVSGTVGGRNAFFSPDGEWIGFLPTTS